jgi:threonine synthase
MQLNPALSGVSCFSCRTPHDPRTLLTVCRACGMPLRADYSLSPATLPRERLQGRAPTLWRYEEILPIRHVDAVSLGEGMTPLLDVSAHVHASISLPLTASSRPPSLLVKDEARNPTGSFKARGMALAVSMARALGARSLQAPSAGNAAGALAAYGAAAGLPVFVAMPEDTPRAFVDECRHYGAKVKLVPGTIADAGRFLRESGEPGAFDVSTLKEPWRVEGK